MVPDQVVLPEFTGKSSAIDSGFYSVQFPKNPSESRIEERPFYRKINQEPVYSLRWFERL